MIVQTVLKTCKNFPSCFFRLKYAKVHTSQKGKKVPLHAFKLALSNDKSPTGLFDTTLGNGKGRGHTNYPHPCVGFFMYVPVIMRIRARSYVRNPYILYMYWIGLKNCRFSWYMYHMKTCI